MRKIYLLFFITLLTNAIIAQSIAGFEDFNLPLDTFLNDNGGADFQSGSAAFPNNFSPDFGGFWSSGWAITTSRDDSTAAFTNLYGSITGSGNESNTYAVGQQFATVHVRDEFMGKVVDGVYITNSTFAYKSMTTGDDFAKKFGGDDGTEPDFFKLEIQGFHNGMLSTKTVEFYLADFRFEADSLDYIVNDWRWVDLSDLGNVDSLLFTLVSSDIGGNGINTPLFYCIDDLQLSTFEIDLPDNPNISSFDDQQLANNQFLNGSDDKLGYQSGNAYYPTKFNPMFGGFWESGWAISTVRDSINGGFENLYGAKTGNGLHSFGYAIGQQNAVIQLNNDANGKIVNGFYLTNTTYAYEVIANGNQFSKKFGGESGNDPDFFKLEIQKYSNGTLQPETVEFYLTDFRFDDNSQDYIVKDWQWVDLTSLGNVDSLQFTLSSSDVGDNGINTPLFFAIDNFEIGEEISTSNEEILFNKNQLTIYPNPVIDEIYLDLKDLGIEKIFVFDISGKLLKESKLSNRVDISNLEKGVYLVNVVLDNGNQISKLFFKQ